MMSNTMPLKDFNTLVKDQASAIQAASDVLTDFQSGSILQSIIEANAANSIWIQSLISALLAISRLQTCVGNDVDTFIQQFGFSRPAAAASTGVVTFSRSVTTSISYIPATSTIVQTSINNIQFTTTLDATKSYYEPTTNSYVMGIGITNIDVPVECNVTGEIGNVGVGSIDTINSPLVNVSAVINANTFTNGQNVATDTQTKNDFVLYLQGLSRATYLAIAFAVLSTPLYGNKVKRYQIIENLDQSGNEKLGYFFVVVDDGSGTPSPNMLNAISANVSLYRGLSIMWDVIAPSIRSVTIDMTLTLDDNNFQTEVTANVKNEILNYINLLPIGGTKVVAIPPNTSGNLYYSRLIEVIYDADPHIINVAMVTLNGGISDIDLNSKQIAQATSGSITINY